VELELLAEVARGAYLLAEFSAADVEEARAVVAEFQAGVGGFPSVSCPKTPRADPMNLRIRQWKLEQA
jgi:hypothetical protein